jgi:dTDP-4-amino-4,6-dideoxygalactose transaminase
LGVFGDVSTTSFYPTKNLGGIGDGGAVMTNDRAIQEEVRELKQYGWRKKYQTTRKHGTNSRLDEIQATVLRRKLPHLDEANRIRREIHSRFEKAVRHQTRIVNKSSPGFIAHLAVIEVGDRVAAEEHFSRLGIDTAIHYPIPDHMQSIEPETSSWYLPVTERLSEAILSVPLFPEMSEAEIERVEQSLASLPNVQ